MGKKSLMSSLSWGVKVMVIVVERPALILPEGVYTILKKSLILSCKGISLKLLKENETFVIRIVCVCAMPTVKSLNMITSGFEMKEVPLNSLPATTYGFVIPSRWRIAALSMYSCSSTDSFGMYSSGSSPLQKLGSIYS